MKNIFLLLLLTVFININLSAQTGSQSSTGKGKISGKVVDSLSVEPIEYAVIGLLNEETNKEVNGTTTDNSGSFVINNVSDGKYKIVIYSIGYKNNKTINVQINKGNRSLNLGSLALVDTQTLLQEVTVTAKTPTVEYEVDKIVYNAQNDVSSQGGAAIDILRKVPQVTVDINGNVELQGNANIRFLINGKPSSIFGNSLADALATIPASQIKSIEAITSPGAKYDAQGTGGIINIILIENKMKGMNGNVNVSAGTRFESGSLNLNFRNNNFGINAFFNANEQLSSHTPNSQDRNSTDTSAKTNTHLIQDGYTDFKRHGYNTGMGFDWTLNKKNSITGGLTYNQFGNQSTNFLNQEQITRDALSVILDDTKGYRNSDIRSVNNSIDYNLTYKKNFKKDKQELTVAYVASYGRPTSHYTQTQSYFGENTPYTGTSGNNTGTDNNINISVDYTHPVSDKLTIETGIKHVEQNINSATDAGFLDPTSGGYQNESSQSYHLNYNMKIYAGYLSSSFTVLNWLDVRAGMRSEYTGIKIDFPNTTVPSYNTIVPSLILSHKFSKNRQVKISYTRRIERAEYAQLNPFLNLSDPHNITTGNPQLRPEISDNIELGYSKQFTGGGNMYISFNERINTQDHKQITTFYSAYHAGDSVYSNVSVTNFQNIGAEYNSGGNLSLSVPVTDKLNARGNFGLVNRYIVSSLADVGNVYLGFRCRVNLNLTYQMPKNLVIEAFGNYNSATKNIQGLNPQSLSYTLAFKKQFWNKKASIGFTATNPFNQYVRQETTINTSSYSSVNIRQLPYRSFGIIFTYKFGKLEFKKGKDDRKNDFIDNQPGAN